jgi:hypothetical protein
LGSVTHARAFSSLAAKLHQICLNRINIFAKAAQNFSCLSGSNIGVAHGVFVIVRFAPKADIHAPHADMVGHRNELRLNSRYFLRHKP